MVDFVVPIPEQMRWLRSRSDKATNSTALEVSANGVDWVYVYTTGPAFGLPEVPSDPAA